MFELGFLLLATGLGMGQPAAAEPLFRVLDLDRGREETVSLRDGSVVRVELLGTSEVRDSLRGAVRRAEARLKVNGTEIVLACGNYELPVTIAGVQVDCAVTKAVLANSRSDPWGLVKEARIRVWPEGSPFMPPGTYVYPVKQRWFATDTQMSNQPVFVDGGEIPWGERVYYHYGLDVGGAEGLTDVVAATEGLVVVRGASALEPHRASPYTEVGYDGVVVLDDRGWFHWYFHLFSIDEGVKLGSRVAMGQPIGKIGKEGGAGCWSHLHYEIRAPQPSGKPGIVEGYAFFWEAYVRDVKPAVIAIARPHSYAAVGETVALDGSRSWSRNGRIVKWDWAFQDGTAATGPQQTRVYQRPGTYSEVLRVTDETGVSAFDFAVVQIASPTGPGSHSEDELAPTIHASFWPTQDIRPGQPVEFLVRTCRTTHGQETWDFGDGSAQVTVRSDGCADEDSTEGYARTSHFFERPGDYLVKVERANVRGEMATAHLWVSVRRIFRVG